MHASLNPSHAIHWTESGQDCSALWRSERGAPAPKRVVLADDTTTADDAYHLACEGTALLWRGDFQNARQMLQALARRIDKTPARKKRAQKPTAGASASPADAFNQHRQAQSQRARVLGMVLIPFDADHSIPLRRAPDARLACTEAWGPFVETDGPCVASLRDLLGMTSAHEWRKKGVEVMALGLAPNNRIHPHYGVFSPVRGEYVALVAACPLPSTGQSPYAAFDIGTGTGVLSAVLARRGVAHVSATDQDPRALLAQRPTWRCWTSRRRWSCARSTCLRRALPRWWYATRRGYRRVPARPLSTRCMTRPAACCWVFWPVWLSTWCQAARAG